MAQQIPLLTRMPAALRKVMKTQAFRNFKKKEKKHEGLVF